MYGSVEDVGPTAYLPVAMSVRAASSGNSGDAEGEGRPRPRRFDTAELVNNEIVVQFIDREYLDPEDDRIMDELLAKPVAAGLTVGDLVSREQLRDQLRRRRDAAPAEVPTPIPVSPQRRRQAARDRPDRPDRAGREPRAD